MKKPSKLATLGKGDIASHVPLTLQSLINTIASAVSPALAQIACASIRLVFSRWLPTCKRVLYIVLRQHNTIPAVYNYRGSKRVSVPCVVVNGK